MGARMGAFKSENYISKTGVPQKTISTGGLAQGYAENTVHK